MGLGELTQAPGVQRRVAGLDIQRKVALQPAVENVLAQHKVVGIFAALLQDPQNGGRSFQVATATPLDLAVLRTPSRSSPLRASAASSNV